MALDVSKLFANSRFLVQELLARGVTIDALSDDQEILLAKHGNRVEALLGVESSLMSRPTVVLTDNKMITKCLLQRAGLSTPCGEKFDYDYRFAAMAYSVEAVGPLVLKPVIGTHGKDVYLPLENVVEVEEAIEEFHRSQSHSFFILEEFFPGKEFRVFVTSTGKFAVLEREPAWIIGDGKHSISTLVATENDYRMNPRKGCLCAIVLDTASAMYLAKTKRTFDTVPKEGEKVHLRANSNSKTGGTCADVTNITHPSVIEIANQVLKAIPNLPYAGIDFITHDISQPQNANSYRIVEVNSEPAIGIHMAPWRGESQNVAAWLADMIFPETAQVTAV
jgi:D-alanine-D-alanine ligase-like ATP-grasp enzyme